MTFILIALALIAVTLLFILPPLLRREHSEALAREDVNLILLRDQLAELRRDLDAGQIDAASYESARSDIQARVSTEVSPTRDRTPPVDKRGAAPWLAMFGIPALALALYVVLGNPLALIATETGGNDPHTTSQQDIADMVDSLAKRLEQEPNDAAGWDMLARSYNVLGQYEKAGAAYARLLTLTPNDADVLADYADTLGMANGRSLKGEPTALINKALQINPNHMKALALAGTAAFERGDYKNALIPWKKILALAPPESDIYRSTLTSIQETEIRMNGNAGAARDKLPSADTVAGTVDIDPALRGQLDDESTVFVFAREAGGPPAPVAVMRKRVKDLPFEFVLDDTMSMTPDRRLSGTKAIVVGARISPSGRIDFAADAPQGLSGVVRPGAHDIRVLISSKGD